MDERRRGTGGMGRQSPAIVLLAKNDSPATACACVSSARADGRSEPPVRSSRNRARPSAHAIPGRASIKNPTQAGRDGKGKSTTKDASSLRAALLKWFRGNSRDLPWRRTHDPYRIWLSEVMLQQTRVEAVIPYYERFLAAFPTVEKLAAARLDRVLQLWAGLGYYSRARNLHAAAKAVLTEYNGRFPRTAVQLATLPGVGRYTAAAIASIAFGEPAAVLDGNVKRVLARVLAIRDSIDERRTVDRLWEEAAALLDASAPGDFNQAVMELGATVCIPRAPRCSECPIHAQCAAVQLGIADALPLKAPKPEPPIVRAVAAAIHRDGKLLVVQRPPRGLLGGMWTLPGGEVVTGQAPETVLASHALAQTGCAIIVERPLGEIRHQFTHRSLRLTVYRASLLRAAAPAGPATLRALRWIDSGKRPPVALATVDRKAVALVDEDREHNQID